MRQKHTIFAIVASCISMGALAQQAIITTPPDIRLLQRRQAPAGYSSCSVYSSIISFCSHSGYTAQYGAKGLAVCGCYQNYIWVPNEVDNIAAACYAYAQTQNPTLASYFTSFLGYCQSQGDVRQSISSDLYACSAFNTVFAQCSSKGYSNLQGTSQLQACACYTTNNGYVPQVFDGFVSSCYNYVQTADTTYATNVASFLNLCSRAGDVRFSTSQGSSACSAVSSILSYCSANNVGFGADPLPEQASCLCYVGPNTEWVPSQIDATVSTCYSYARPFGGNYPQFVETYLGLCSRVGNIRANGGSGSGGGGSEGGGSGGSGGSSGPSSSAIALNTIESGKPAGTAAPGSAVTSGPTETGGGSGLPSLGSLTNSVAATASRTAAGGSDSTPTTAAGGQTTTAKASAGCLTVSTSSLLQVIGLIHIVWLLGM